MKIIKILFILTLLFGFSQCGSNTFVKNPSFKVEKAFYNHWVGGQPGVRGTKVEMHLKDASEINFDALYFQGKVTKVEVSMKDGFVQVIKTLYFKIENISKVALMPFPSVNKR